MVRVNLNWDDPHEALARTKHSLRSDGRTSPIPAPRRLGPGPLQQRHREGTSARVTLQGAAAGEDTR